MAVPRRDQSRTTTGAAPALSHPSPTVGLVIERVDMVAHGRPAAEVLADVLGEIKARGGALAPVTVIVPSNFAGLAARRLLGSGHLRPTGLANVSFVTPFRLAELLAAHLLGDRRPLTNPVLASAVRRALADDPGPFHAVADHLATEQALAALYAELSHVSEASLVALEAAGGGAAAAVRQYRSIAARLTAFHDEDDVATAAADRRDLEGALRPFGHLIWFLPQPTTPALTRFVGSVLGSAPAVVLVGVSGVVEADAPVLSACRRAGVAVPDVPPPEVAPPVAAHIVSVTDADEEVRAVVRRIAQLAESGVPLSRIAVFHPTPQPYLRTLRQQLAAAGIPANGPSEERLADGVAGRTLLAALALPACRWRRDRVMALVAGAPVRHQGAPVHPTAWEVLSRRAGVVSDLGDWRRKLDAYDGRLAARAASVDRPLPPGAAERIQRERDDLNQLGRFVEELAGAVLAVDGATDWRGKASAALALLRRLLGSESARERWPEGERVAAERVEDALARLAALDEVEPRPTAEVFRRALAAELDVQRGRDGRFGHGVLYGPLSAAVGQDLDAVFILGMAEGSCPAPRRDDALLPEASRALALDDELPPRARSLHDQHRWYLAALAAAPEQGRWLVHPRGDLRGGRSRLPSRWLLDTASALVGDVVYSTDFNDLEPPVVEVVTSFAGGLTAAAGLASVDELDLVSVARHAAAGADAALHPASTPVRRGLEAQRARRSPACTTWDGNLSGHPVPSPARGEVLSATRLERWAGCGFRYLLGDVLGLSDRDEPERTVELGPLDRGSFVHSVLERFFLEVLDEGPPDPGTPWSAAHHRRLAEVARNLAAEYEQAGRTGRPVRWRLQLEQLLALLDDFLLADDHHRSTTRSRPVRVELPFGMDGADPVAIELGDGRRVLFRGKADRVDVTDDDRYLVSDYKTGSGRAYADLEDDPVRAGTTLQLGLYSEAAIQLLGARSAAGHYWVLPDEKRSERHGYDWTDERRMRFVEVIAAIVDGIEDGAFAAVPGEWDGWRRTHTNCTYCEFDRLCPVDRGEQAAAKASSVELQVRRRLLPVAAEDQP